MMKHRIAAAALLATTLAALPGGAQAQGWNRGGGYYHGGGYYRGGRGPGVGPAIVGGLALGALAAGVAGLFAPPPPPRVYYAPPPPPAYYPPPGYYAPPPGYYPPPPPMAYRPAYGW